MTHPFCFRRKTPKKVHFSSHQSNQGTREELVARLRADYDRNYFLTGDIDVPLYTEDCEFADPFTSFRGRQRFVQNLKILWIRSGV